MERAFATPAVAADAAAVTDVVVALESSLYGQSAFSQADLEDEWSDLDVEQDACVVRAGDRIVGYGAVRERGELWRVEGYVHPDAFGRGIGKLIATGLEEDAARRGARRIQNSVLEVDCAARRLLESLGYGAVRVFRELRIELTGPPPAPTWPDGLRVVSFDAEHDALEFHAAHQEAFADHWDHSRAISRRGQRATSTASALTRRCGASSAPATRSPPGRSARATRTAAALSTRSSHVARGASRASVRRSSATRSGASGSVASAASDSAPTRRATPARFASTSAPGWRQCSAG